MIEDIARRQAAEARALIAALAIAKKVGWQFERAGPVLSIGFAGYLYVASAQLLLVPSGSALPFAALLADQATREARSDALVMSCTDGDTPRISLALGLWSLDETRWTTPALPWLSGSGELWLTPPEGEEAWRLPTGRVTAAPIPWATIEDRYAGRERFDRWIAGVVA